MTQITGEQIDEYLKFVSNRTEPPEGMIPVGAFNNGYIIAAAMGVAERAVAANANPFGSLWISAFLMGREFECRLRTDDELAKLEMMFGEPKIPSQAIPAPPALPLPPEEPEDVET